MRTIQHMYCAAATILLVMLALATTGWAQPVVTVPSFCNVVVAGSGGTLGFGGDVGNGGVVVMPDPSGAGTFTVNPMGNTILGWSLAGDLSVAPNAQPAPAIQSLPAGTLSASLTSYNKIVRVSELTPPSADYLARSKGRVSISYTNPSATCGGGIQFDIFKEYINSGWPSSGTQDGYVPPIIGPDCIEPSTLTQTYTYTYSVDQIATDNYSDGIGGDDYYWSITPSLGTFYNSADLSSITFTTPMTLSGPYTIQCCFGKANPWGGAPSTCVTKVVGMQPGNPSFSTPPPSCVQTTAGASFNIAINPVGSYMYSWAASNTAWILTPSGSQNENLSVTSLGDDPGIITLTITNGSCDPTILTYNIERELAAPVTINSTGSCVAAGTTNNYQLSSGLQNATSWTIPTGWGITNANGAWSSVNITVPSGTPAGAYVISAASTACPSGVLNYTINVQPATPVISGPSCVTRNGGSPVVYNSTASSGATSYTWSWPTSWMCLANCTSASSVVVQPGGTAITPQNITVTAVGTNGCNAVSAPFVVNYNPVTPAAITTSCFSFGVPGTTTVTVTNRPVPFYGGFTITSTPSGLITGSSVNASGIITINTSASAPAGAYTLDITHTTTACGNSSTVSFPITFGGNGAIVTPVYNPGVGNSDVYIISGAPVGSTYQWYVNGNPVPAGSGGTASVLVLSGNGTPPSTIWVDITSGGCTTRVNTTPGTHSLLPEIENGEMEHLLAQVEVYPNPTDGNFVIKIPAFEREASLQIVDSSGKEVGTHSLKKGENRISERGMMPGTYFLILNMDGKYSSHKLQVSQK